MERVKSDILTLLNGAGYYVFCYVLYCYNFRTISLIVSFFLCSNYDDLCSKSSYVLLYSHSLFVVSKGLLISFLQLYILLGFVPLISINQITLIRIKSDCIDFIAAVVYEILSLPFFFCTS